MTDIDAIRRREQAATKGPWPLITDACGCNGEYPCGHGDYPIGFGPFYSVEHSGTEQAHADHVFAAHARQDIPALLAKVDELHADNARLRAELADARNQAHRDATNHQQIVRANTELANERDALAEKVDELTAALAAARGPADRFGELADEPDPEVTKVYDHDGDMWVRSPEGWRYRTASGDGDPWRWGAVAELYGPLIHRRAEVTS